jgi:uncharacterized integral membrane protein
MRLVVWLLRGFIFFTLFAFALNNQQTAVVRWFFGIEWHAPMVIVVLVAFAAGCAIGVLAMVPGWWRQRRAAQQHAASASKAALASTANAPASMDFGPDYPPREGL